MVHLSCHCGRVRLTTAGRPDFIHACNCSLCRKSGAHWGYFAPADVRVEGETARYRREDKPEPGATIHFCRHCGATTHFTLTEATVTRFGDTMRGVNMRLADESALVGIELRYPDGRAWAGSGDFGYVRPPRILGAAPA